MSLKNDTVYNLLGNGIPLLAAAGAIPYLLTALGNEKFGILALIWSLIGYFGLFDFGVGRALTYEVGRRKDSGNREAIKRIIKAGLLLTLLTGIFGSILVYCVIAPYSATWLKVSLAEGSAAQAAFEIAAFGIIPTTLTSGLRGALEGFKRFVESNINRALLGTLMFLVPMIVVMGYGANIAAVAIGLVGVRFFICGIAIFQLRKNLDGSFKLLSTDIKPLLNFGVWVTISGLVGPLMVYGDRFFVSAAVGAEALPLYAIPQEGLQRLLIIPAALTAALLPRMAAVIDKVELQKIYNENIRRIAIAMLFVLVAASFLALPILSVWISKEFAEKTIPIVIILCVGLWFNSMAQMPMTLLHSIGKPKLAAVSHLIELPLYVAAIMFLSKEFGIIGAAAAWSLRVVLDFFVFNYFAKMSLK
ncbi:MAG: Flippase [Polaromonas sp.]|nr:Flippase [Polaromonas sp.]